MPSTPRSLIHVVCLPVMAALVLAEIGCGSDAFQTPTGPTTPPTTVTDTFSETLNQNGARTHPFSVSRAGTVTAQITALAPDEAATIGLSLGTWNGSACQIILANDTATIATPVTGTANSAGLFCARVYDVGQLTGPITYTIDVVHY